MAITSSPSAVPANGAVAIVPADGADLTISPSRALFVGTAGNVNVDTAQGDTVLFKNVPAGSILPVSVRRVRSTNTTAADIVALY